LYLFNFDNKNSAEKFENGSEAILLRIRSTIATGYGDGQLCIYSFLALARDFRMLESR